MAAAQAVDVEIWRCGIPGQIILEALSDRLGRECIWTAGCAGFAACYVALIAMEYVPLTAWLYVMVFTQGFFGYALTSVMRPIVAEIFEGPHDGAIFGTITVALIGGGGAGPWFAGATHDATGSYRAAFIMMFVFYHVAKAGELARSIFALYTPAMPPMSQCAILDVS